MSTRSVYNARWRKVRARVLERDGHRCQIRGEHCEGRANEVDHVVPWESGGALYDEGNLRAACRPCNAGRAARNTNLKRGRARSKPSREW